MSIIKQDFGTLCDGTKVSLYKLSNAGGAYVNITDFGGAVVKICVPDRNNKLSDVICGYDKLESYVNADGYQGALIGRCGNRICRGKFSLDGKEYNLFHNDGENHLHGGKRGFSHRVWNAEICGDNCLRLHLVSEDGDEGYPGRLSVTVEYRLTEKNNENSFSISYTAVTDKKTVLNLTNHSYFNLSGYDSGSILDHELWLDADAYLPTFTDLIPTGEKKPVAGTPFDFRTAKRIGRDISADDTDLKNAGGYDHCFVFSKNANNVQADGLPCRCILSCPASGRKMRVFTDRPCVQVYTGNFMSNEKFPFKNNVKQIKQHAVCLETQTAPDAVNHPELGFNDCILNPGDKLHTVTEYRFGLI